MNTRLETTKQVFEDYHRFDDGLILWFKYFYLPNEPLMVEMVFHARSHTIEGKVWRKVKVVVRDVQEMQVRVNGNQFNTISSGVKLLQFGSLWCVDIDGTYNIAGDPSSLEEVRKDG